MPGDPSRHRSLRRFRVGILAGSLLVLAGLTLTGQLATQAGAPPFAPHTAAFFKTNDQLLVAVALPATAGKPLTGRLRVEVLGKDGKTLAQAEQTITQKVPLANYRFELPVAKAKAEDLTLRCRLGEQKHEVTLN